MHMLIFLFFIYFKSLIAQTIYIYADQGTCEECIQQTEKSLMNEISLDINIKRINASEILDKTWMHDAQLLIIPGGRAGPYANLLSNTGNALIRRYVEEGGSYLGLCAGGYYGSSLVEFARGTELEIIRSHELGFFAGKAIGPALGAYDYYSESGASIAHVTFGDNSPSIFYYNGGPYFENAAYDAHTRILGSFDDLDGKAAIIEVAVGRGRVVLSGVHFEYSSEMLRRVDPKIQELHDIELARIKLWRDILNRLKIILQN
jgi:glutamine amidotransferase-like uncharacterized protein